MASYVELMGAVVKQQTSIIGLDISLRQARKVQGIVLDDQGMIISGASKEALAKLVEAYKGLAGPVAVRFAKKAIAPLLTGTEDLPENLK